MADSLRDQLLSLGLAKPKAQKAPARKAGTRQGDTPARGRKGAPPARRSQEEIDLARAYAIRAEKEKRERLAAEREAQERAREKRERKAKLGALLKDQARNEADADVQRHFQHMGRIRHVYVTADQLAQVNTGALGIVQFAGRYLLVERTVAEEARAIAEEALVLLVDPDETPEDDVPADLAW